MPPQGRLGDKASVPADAHGCPACPHPAVGPAIIGSPDVSVNSRPALRVDDGGVHAACCNSNTWKAQEGSAGVFINGKAAFRQGDPAKHCGGQGRLIEGSNNVIVGDSGGGGSSAGSAATGGRSATARSTAPRRDSRSAADGDGRSLGVTSNPGATRSNTASTNTANSVDAPNDSPTVDVDQVHLQLVNPAGIPQRSMEVELTLSSGEKRAGRTTADGHCIIDGIQGGGNAHLDVPDVQSAPDAPPTIAARVRYTEGGIDVRVGRFTIVELPPRVRRIRLKGMHFETAKTFLLPSAMHGIRELVKLYQSFEGIVGLITGHTDKQGAAEYNRCLSQERADAIKAFLVDDLDAWQAWYGSPPCSKPWGVREDQHMLSTVRRDPADPSSVFYAGRIDGVLAHTASAYKAFQAAHGEAPSDRPTPATRRALVGAYMALDGTSLAGAQLETHGCGLTHPLPETSRSTKLNEPANRRVEVFLFEGAIDPPAQTPCPPHGCPEYKRWVDTQILDVDLDHDPGNLAVTVVDNHGPLSGAQVHLSGPLALDAVTSQFGIARFDDLVPGTYRAIASRDGYAAEDVSVTVGSGTSRDVTLEIRPRLPKIMAFTAEPRTVRSGDAVTLRWRVTGDFDHLTIKSANSPARGFPPGTDPARLTAAEGAVDVTVSSADVEDEYNHIEFWMNAVPRAGGVVQGARARITVLDGPVPFIETDETKTGIRRINTSDHGRLAIIARGEDIEFYFATKHATHVQVMFGGNEVAVVAVGVTGIGTCRVAPKTATNFRIFPVARGAGPELRGSASETLLLEYMAKPADPIILSDPSATGIRHLGTTEEGHTIELLAGEDAEIYWRTVNADVVRLSRHQPTVIDPIAVLPADQGTYRLVQPRHQELYLMHAGKTRSDGSTVYGTSNVGFIILVPQRRR